jgi:hypothetical protein
MAGAGPRGGFGAVHERGVRDSRRNRDARGIRDAAGEQAPLAAGVEVGQYHGDGLTDEPATIRGDAATAQGEPGAFQIEQLVGGQVNGDLMRMLLPATRRTVRGYLGTGRSGTKQLRHAWKAYPS